MQLYFIRHAQSENNILFDLTGSNDGRSEDPELTELGYQQANVLAEFLGRSATPTHKAGEIDKIQDIRLTHLYSSLMVRALATGAAIAKTTGLCLTGWLDLYELGGIYQKNPHTAVKQGLPGHTKSYLRQQFPELILPCSIGEQGWWDRPHEDDQAGLNRARRVYLELLERHGKSDDRLGLVSHGDFYQLFLSVVLGLRTENLPFFKLNNAAISRIDIEEDQTRVMYLNRIDYLRPS